MVIINGKKYNGIALNVHNCYVDGQARVSTKADISIRIRGFYRVEIKDTGIVTVTGTKYPQFIEKILSYYRKRQLAKRLLQLAKSSKMFGKTYVHTKSGGRYIVIGEGLVQENQEWLDSVIYVSENQNQNLIFTRIKKDEFDEKFSEV